MEHERIVCWFSCGAASAVATKLALENNWLGLPVEIAYCQVIEEHPDNMRFLKECEKWFGQEILILGNDKFGRSIYEVFRQTQYLKGVKGARCTGELKKQVRKNYERPTDLHVFGYTADEQGRLDRFLDDNYQTDVWSVLIEHDVSKQDCIDTIQQAGIEIPEMYKLGYRNANCVGCVKGGMGYWNKIRVDFPHVFERMATVEEAMGRTVCRRELPRGEDGKRRMESVPLRDLPPEAGNYSSELDIECGIFCNSRE